MYSTTATKTIPKWLPVIYNITRNTRRDLIKYTYFTSAIVIDSGDVRVAFTVRSNRKTERPREKKKTNRCFIRPTTIRRIDLDYNMQVVPEKNKQVYTPDTCQVQIFGSIIKKKKKRDLNKFRQSFFD